MIHRSGENKSAHVRCTLIGLHHDVSQKNFCPLSVQYFYTEQTPEGYFYEIYKDKTAIPLVDEQLLKK